MKKILRIFVFLIVFYLSMANDEVNNSEDDYSDYNENVYRKYIQMDKQLKEIAENSVKKLIPFLLKSREHVNVSATCTKNLFDFITGFRKLTSWSFNFLDAIGKLQSGVQVGNLQMFGEYEECVETTVMQKEKVNFEGQYCSILIKPFLPKVKRIPGMNSRLEGLVNATRNSSGVIKSMVSRVQLFYAVSIKLGICVPSGCTKEDISEIINYTLKDFVNAKVSHCLKKGDIFYWTKTRIAFVSIFVFLGTIVVVSTFLDNTLESWKNKEIGLKVRIFQCFSLTRNFPKLMNTDVSEKSIGCLHGVRVLTILWIILGHEYFLHAVSLTANHAINIDKMLPKFFAQIALNGFVSVDMFFFISGFVNCYSRMLIKEEGRSQPGILKVIAHRLWRIYPAYIAALFLWYLLLVPQAHNNPAQKLILQNCDVHWWRNFLFIGNLFDPQKMCMAQAWYLCVDMQLFLLSLITVPVFFRNAKKGVILHIGIILIVNFCSMTYWFVDHIPPATLDATRLDRGGTMKRYKIYVRPAVHVGSYCIGILLGYVIATKKNIKIPKVTQLFGWFAASLFFISMIFMTYRWNSGIPYTQVESALYGAWSRTIMVLGFSWLVFCCATGHAGLINYILSLKLWVPMSRLTYLIYLLSPMIQLHYRMHQSFPLDFSNINIIWNYFADVSISILMSFALALIVESPVISMEKVLFRRNEEKTKTSFDLPNEMTSNSIKENGSQGNEKITTIHL